MNKRWKALVSVFGCGIVALSVVMLVGTVSADGFVGTGSIVAEGDGWVWLHGEGEIVLSGQGTLVIVDRAGDATINIEHSGETASSAAPKQQPGGRLVFQRFDGTASISGSNVIVTMTGRNIHLEAKGTGVVRLRGHGWYKVNNSRGDWNLRGPELRFGDPSADVASAQAQG